MAGIKPVVKKYYEVIEEKLPSDQASNSYIRWLLTDKGGHINAHFHPWEHEIFIVEGNGKIKIGSKIYEISSDNFIYIPPNINHEYWADTDLKFICIIPSKPTAEKVERPIEA